MKAGRRRKTKRTTTSPPVGQVCTEHAEQCGNGSRGHQETYLDQTITVVGNRHFASYQAFRCFLSHKKAKVQKSRGGKERLRSHSSIHAMLLSLFLLIIQANTHQLSFMTVTTFFSIGSLRYYLRCHVLTREKASRQSKGSQDHAQEAEMSQNHGSVLVTGRMLTSAFTWCSPGGGPLKVLLKPVYIQKRCTNSNR